MENKDSIIEKTEENEAIIITQGTGIIGSKHTVCRLPRMQYLCPVETEEPTKKRVMCVIV